MKAKALKIILISTLAAALLCLGIGYAAVSMDLTLDLGLTGSTQNKVFITDFEGDATVNGSTFFGSILTSDLTLESGGSATYTVTVHNNADEPYCYVGTGYADASGNVSVTYSNGMKEGDWAEMSSPYTGSTSVVHAGESLTFTITFTHDGSGGALDLSPVMNFKFQPVATTRVVKMETGGVSSFDCLEEGEVKAEFPEISVAPSSSRENVARCNYNGVPVYDTETETVTVDVSGATAKFVTCEIYDSLSEAFNDADISGRTNSINNFLVLCNHNDSGNTTIPANEEPWNVNFAGRTVTHNASSIGVKYIKMPNTSVLTFTSTAYDRSTGESASGRIYKVKAGVASTLGGITSSGRIVEMRSATFNNVATEAKAWAAEAEHPHPVLKVNGGAYVSTGDSYLFEIRQGGSMRFDDAVLENKGNVFNVGETANAEVIFSGESTLNPGSEYEANLEVVGCHVTSTVGNVLHTTTRQKFFCNLFASTLNANGHVINANGGEDAGVYVYENAKLYINACRIANLVTDSTTKHFYTHGTRLYYANLACGGYHLNGESSVETTSLQSTVEGAAENIVRKDANGSTLVNGTILGRSFRVACYADEVEDWYYLKDGNGNLVKDWDDNILRVGDETQFLINRGTTLDVNKVLYALGFDRDFSTLNGISGKSCAGNIYTGQSVGIYADTNSVEQRWTLIPATSYATDGCYYLVSYHWQGLGIKATTSGATLVDALGNRTDTSCIFKLVRNTSVSGKSRYELIPQSNTSYRLGVSSEAEGGALKLVSTSVNVNLRTLAVSCQYTDKEDKVTADNGTVPIYKRQ